jgi:hypothetical protein
MPTVDTQRALPWGLARLAVGQAEGALADGDDVADARDALQAFAAGHPEATGVGAALALLEPPAGGAPDGGR